MNYPFKEEKKHLIEKPRKVKGRIKKIFRLRYLMVSKKKKKKKKNSGVERVLKVNECQMLSAG